MRKEFRNLLPLDEARSTVLDELPLIELESVPLNRAFGRTLGETITSTVEVPGFNRASMDGYAVLSEDTLNAREDLPIPLYLVGTVPMGQVSELEVGPGQAAEVSTGSVIPPGANAVLMVEHSKTDDDTLFVKRPVHVGENVHMMGGDIAFGETVLHPGVRLTAREVGLLAAVGNAEVLAKKLSVSVASTGDEIVSPGSQLKPGQIYDINSYSIGAAVEECGAFPVVYGILPDDHDQMAEGLINMARNSALIIVSGSTSAGRGDMVYKVLEELGEVTFHGMNFKPGKPTLFGHLLGKPFFGLPGYPTSALTVFGQIVAPFIRKVLGTEQKSPEVRGKLARPIRSEGRRQMFSVGIVGGWVYPVDKGSGSITTLAQADGVIDIPAEVEYLDKDEVVKVHLFGDYPEPDLLIMGEDSPELEALVRDLPFRARFVTVGSRRGVLAVQDGVADLAIVSSSIGVAQSWPEPVVKRFRRELVFMAQDSDFLDLERVEDMKVIGWSKQSEMSKIFQKVLDEKGLIPVKFVGLAKTHSAVAAAVNAGKADLGFGTRSVAEDAGLCFVKVAEDEIELLASIQRQGRKALQDFVELLS